ncbi:molybdopterin-dependent oxidoreductase [Marispirochaeta aestuarii]|uniref:molybdopterin-dependent oxidoreductase n=1 Tax=Marispirochaeta aestuarii TaxID=1963862 RepID=UPI0029C8A932|nr:molybdopterin-dependent oxidoreductase [Marispirochaeta aestuarii]
MKRFFSSLFILISMIFMLFSGGQTESLPSDAESSASVWVEEEVLNPEDLEFGDLFMGLHYTAKPIDLDEETYRLTVTGKVDKPLSLSLAEVKALATVDIRVRLVCPGYFTDEGVWSGVLVRTLLKEAGIRDDAKTVIFAVPDESYRTRFPVERATADDFLVAWAFEGETLHRVHGFPLRLVAGDTEGSNWVKWLQIIRVE